MSSVTLEIINKLGLHARAAAKFTGVASKFDSEIMVTHGEKTINAKSIMGLLMLAASKGTHITIEATGSDSEQAIAGLTELINNRFNESE